jgi:S1-C subfamily serine protease
VAPGLRRSEQRTAALTSTEIDASGEQQQPPDVPMAMAVFKPEPARDSRGHYEGMRLEGSGDEASLAAYGLKRDDVITSVNGRAITSQALAMAALQEISSGTPALVTVRRDSVLQDISLTFQTTGG